MFGAVMRMPQDLKLTFRCPIVASDQYQDHKQIRKEVAVRQWKKIVVPLTEEDLARAETNKLEIGLEQVKRRWQANIQVVSR